MEVTPRRIWIAAWPLLLLSTGAGQTRAVPETGYRQWSIYGGGPDSIRYSALDQINRNNVSRLAVAWTVDNRDAFETFAMQCHSIIVQWVLEATTAQPGLVSLHCPD